MVANSEEIFEELVANTVSEIPKPLEKEFEEDSDKNLSQVSSDSELIDVDKFFLPDRIERSRIVTDILEQYKMSYINKVEFQEKGRNLLFYGCISVVGLFSIALVVIWIYFSFCTTSESIKDIAVIISASISVVAAIIKLVEIITQYCFPNNDEDYIVKMVENIQRNDIEMNRCAEKEQQQ